MRGSGRRPGARWSLRSFSMSCAAVPIQAPAAVIAFRPRHCSSRRARARQSPSIFRVAAQALRQRDCGLGHVRTPGACWSAPRPACDWRSADWRIVPMRRIGRDGSCSNCLRVHQGSRGSRIAAHGSMNRQGTRESAGRWVRTLPYDEIRIFCAESRWLDLRQSKRPWWRRRERCSQSHARRSRPPALPAE